LGSAGEKRSTLKASPLYKLKFKLNPEQYNGEHYD